MKSLVGAALGTWWGAGVAGAVCIVFAVVGCGSGAVEGSPTTATQSGQPAFDPCSLPDEALVAAGVDPGTRQSDFFGVRMEGWNLCTWAADWYYLGVAATNLSTEDVRSNPRNVDFADVQVGSRDAQTYHETTDVRRERCDVVFALGGGTLLIRADKKGSEPAAENPCSVAVRSAAALDSYLPTG